MHHRRKSPTMIDIARRTGVFPMTVSRAFKQEGTINEKTRQTILRAAEEIGYVLDSNAASLRSQRSGFVAVTIPSLNNANFADTVKGISDGLATRGLQTLLASTDYDVNEEERLIEQLLRRKPDAIAVTGGKHTARTRRLLLGAGIPVIETWDLPQRPIGHSVGFSNSLAARKMVKYFYRAGYRRIAFIGGDKNRDPRGHKRRMGFISALQEYGLEIHRLVNAGAPPVSMSAGAAAMARLLQKFPDTQAVLCVSDLSAFGALTECARQGIRVPADMAIAGFGNYEISAICVPRLTTVNPFARKIGEQTARLILRYLDDPSSLDTPCHICFEPELIVRETAAISLTP